MQLISTQKGTAMKKLQLFMAVIMLSTLAGCLSIRSEGSPGPQGPQGQPGTSEKVIVVPEKRY